MPDDDEGVHRLSDILVEEVSLVDHPANGRRFLLVKREGDMSELRPNGRGGFVRVTKADDDKEKEEAEKAGKKPPPFGGNKAPPFGKKPAEAAKADPDEEEEEESEEEKAAKKAAGSMVDNMNAASDEEKKKKAKKAGGSPPASEILGELTKAIELAVKAASDMKDHEESEGDLPEKTVKTLKAAHEKFSSCLAMCAKRVPAGKQEFAKAMDSISSLLSELLEGKGGPKGHDADAGDPQKAPAGFSEKNPSGAMAGTPGTMKQLTKGIDELVTIVKSQAKEIRALKSGVAGSNSIPIEKATKRRDDSGGDGVSWPLDMNDERFDKSKVDKSVSFHDVE